MTAQNDSHVIQPYLFFEGRCEEALEFYRQVLGAKTLFLMRFKESPDPQACPAGGADKVMHATIQIGQATLMASDGGCSGNAGFHGFALSITVPDAAAAERIFAALLDGGEVRMPLAQTFFSPRFGMVADRFGVVWMVHVAGPSPEKPS